MPVAEMLDATATIHLLRSFCGAHSWKMHHESIALMSLGVGVDVAERIVLGVFWWPSRTMGIE